MLGVSFLLLLLLLLLHVTTRATLAEMPRYYLVNDLHFMEHGEGACVASGGQLASICNDQEESAAMKVLSSVHRAWIAMVYNKKTSEYEWSKNSYARKSGCSVIEPNWEWNPYQQHDPMQRPCITIGGDGYWEAFECNWRKKSLCELREGAEVVPTTPPVYLEDEKPYLARIIAISSIISILFLSILIRIGRSLCCRDSMKTSPEPIQGDVELAKVVSDGEDGNISSEGSSSAECGYLERTETQVHEQILKV